MSEGRASHACPSQWEASVSKATTEPLWGAGLRDASTHPPEIPRPVRRPTTSGAAPPGQMGCSPLIQSGGESIRAVPSTGGGVEGKEKSRWRAVKRKKEKERKPRLACWRSRLVRSRAGWRPLHRSWSLVLGAALLAAGSSPTTGQARPDRTRQTGARIGPCPQLTFPSRAEGPK